MKVYKHDKGIVFSGKPWEIRYILKKYQKKYTYIYEWINDQQKIESKKTLPK